MTGFMGMLNEKWIQTEVLDNDNIWASVSAQVNTHI